MPCGVFAARSLCLLRNGWQPEKAQGKHGLPEPNDFYPETLTDKSYAVPSGILVIGESAFKNDALSEIVLPDTLTTIETKAFLACTNLTSLSVPAAVKLH